MLRRILPVLMLSTLLLTGCGSKAESQFHAAKLRLDEAEQVRFTAQLQADCGDALENYTLDYCFRADDWQAVVKSPEVLAGIKATCTDEDSTLTYDRVVLSTGQLTQRGTSPITAVPLMLRALTEGITDSLWTEGEYLVSKQLLDDTLAVTTWMDGEGVPRAFELTENGIVKARCKFSYAEIKESNHGTTEETHLGGD